MFMKKKTVLISTIIVVCLAVIAYAISIMFAQARDSLEITNAWVPLAPPKAKIMAAYVTIENPTDDLVEITEVTSPDFAHVMIHETVVEDGVSRMEMRDKLLLTAGEKVVMQRGGLHLMLMYKKRVFKQGDTVILKFTTSKGTVTVTAPVKVASLDNQ